MVPCVSPIVLVFDTNHHESKYCKKQEIAQAETKNSIHLKPFFWRCIIKRIYPWDVLEEGRGELAEEEGEDEGGREKAAVREAG